MSSQPSAASCAYASLTTPRETAKSPAKARDEGRRSPATRRPERMAARSWFSTWRCSGPAPRSSATRTSLAWFSDTNLDLTPEPEVPYRQRHERMGQGRDRRQRRRRVVPVSDALTSYDYVAGQLIRYAIGAVVLAVLLRGR